jgi:hypothetical protein
MKSGFWQIQIDPKDRYKTAFTVPFGQYEWNVYIYIYYVNIKACVYHVVLKKSKYSTIYFYNINIYFKLSLGQI